MSATMQSKNELVRVWLSAAIPDEASDEDRDRIRRFVLEFSKYVYRQGWKLVHGCHPTITPVVIDAARAVGSGPGQAGGLVLVRSEHFADADPTQDKQRLDEWNAVCAEPVIRVRSAAGQATDAEIEQESLALMRTVLCEQGNVFVAIGGRWWETAVDRAGVPDEIELAAAARLPLFLLAGAGGATHGFLQENKYLLDRCNNGLADGENIALSFETDPDGAAGKIFDQVRRLPVRHRDPDSGRPFRILTLDGGGIRGVYTATVLKYWEEATGKRVADHFDLIAGTSTGGLLAIGLGLGLSAARMQKLYLDEGASIFPTDTAARNLWHGLRHWFASKFDQNTLKQKLSEAYKESPAGKRVSGEPDLDESVCRLLIPSYNATADRVLLFRTPHGRFKGTNAHQNSVSAALSTAAAPTYFDPVGGQGGSGQAEAIDGGVWANDPSIAAIAEATGQLGIPLSRIAMLSIGTTYRPGVMAQPFLLDGALLGRLIASAIPIVGTPIGWTVRGLSWVARLFWQPKRVHGKLGWAANIAGLLLKTQSQTASHSCESLLGKSRYLRVDSASDTDEMDDVTAMSKLVGLAEHEAAAHRSDVESRFLTGVPADRWS